MKNIQDMTLEEFRELPYYKNKDGSVLNENEELFDSLIILPDEIPILSVIRYNILSSLSKRLHCFRKPEIYEIQGLHDSGYRRMYFVVCKDNKPLYRLAGGSDVLHIDGIGGLGYNWLDKFGGVPNAIEPHSWSIDCLPTSGLLRVFCRGKIKTGTPLSSFEIFCIREKNKGEMEQ